MKMKRWLVVDAAGNESRAAMKEPALKRGEAASRWRSASPDSHKRVFIDKPITLTMPRWSAPEVEVGGRTRYRSWTLSNSDSAEGRWPRPSPSRLLSLGSEPRCDVLSKPLHGISGRPMVLHESPVISTTSTSSGDAMLAQTLSRTCQTFSEVRTSDVDQASATIRRDP